MTDSNPLETIMNREIVEIKNSPPNVVSFDYRAIIHTPNMDINALMVNSVSLLRDYLTRFGDVTSIQVVVPLGDGVHDILPNHTELEMTVIKTPLLSAAVYTRLEDIPQRSVRYTAKLYNVKDALLEGKRLLLANKKVADQTDMLTLDFQLISPLLEKIRTRTFGGAVRNSTGVNLIRAVLMTHSDSGSEETDDVVKGVTIDPNFSDKVYEHIVVPHNTRVVDLPKKVNKLVGGIYPTGFRYYLQKDQWYIFAPWNVKRYEGSQNTLTIINLEKDRLSEMEVTFRRTATQVILLATGDTEHLDESEHLLQSVGNGVRFVDSSQVVDGFGEVGDNKFTVNRSTNITQAVNAKTPRKVNYASESINRITNSYNLEYSELARRSGSVIQVVWESSNPDLLYPGMPIRFMYMDGDIAREVYGRLLATETQTRQSVRTPKNKIFTNDTIITFFVAFTSKETPGPVPVKT